MFNRRILRVFIIVGVMMFGLLGCRRKNGGAQPETPKDSIELSVANEIKEADIWIIPDTEENRKTTLWGKATLSKLMDGEEKKVSVERVEKYLVRMIDTDQMFYSADGVTLEGGQTVRLKEGQEKMSAVLEVFDGDGTLIAEYSMFEARL